MQVSWEQAESWRLVNTYGLAVSAARLAEPQSLAAT